MTILPETPLKVACFERKAFLGEHLRRVCEELLGPAFPWGHSEPSPSLCSSLRASNEHEMRHCHPEGTKPGDLEGCSTAAGGSCIFLLLPLGYRKVNMRSHGTWLYVRVSLGMTRKCLVEFTGNGINTPAVFLGRGNQNRSCALVWTMFLCLN